MNTEPTYTTMSELDPYEADQPTHRLDPDYVFAEPSTVAALEEALNAASVECEADLSQTHWDYSGRGMYGATCFGWSGDLQSFLLTLGALWAEAGRDFMDLTETLGSLEHDNLGRSTIWYWPSLRTYATA